MHQNCQHLSAHLPASLPEPPTTTNASKPLHLFLNLIFALVMCTNIPHSESIWATSKLLAVHKGPNNLQLNSYIIYLLRVDLENNNLSLKWQFLILLYYDKLNPIKQNRIHICTQTGFHNVNANNASSRLREKVILTNFGAKIWLEILVPMWMWEANTYQLMCPCPPCSGVAQVGL